MKYSMTDRSSGLLILSAIFSLGCQVALQEEMAAPTDAPDGDAHLHLIENGQPVAVVVTPDEPDSPTLDAVTELVSIIERRTGAKLPVVTESGLPTNVPVRIFIGDTAAARTMLADPATLARDQSILRVVGQDLYIVGEAQGVWYGVLEILERYAGVVWAWPGELGTYVPSAAEWTVPADLDHTWVPKIQERHIRTGGPAQHVLRDGGDYEPAIEQMAFTRVGLERYWDAIHAYRNHHRLGATERVPRGRHAFAGFWQEHGEAHPEWFWQSADGERPGSTGRHVPMCVSNPELHRFIVDQWQAGRWPRPVSGEADVIDLGEVDRSST